MLLQPQTLQDFTAHCVSEFPLEACGLVVNGNYIPCPNSSLEPSGNFRIDPLHWVKAEAFGTVEAVLHSHPYDKRTHQRWPAEWPSTSDMESWMKGDIPWGVASTDGEGISQVVWLDEAHPEPIEGRDFIHGINDCYSLIRDWFKANRGITLPNFPRGVEWWFQGKNYYDENFDAAGFVTIKPEEATIGDCVMIMAAAKVTNHAAVITGPNEITHHLFNRLSGTDSLAKWGRHIVRTVRYIGPKC